MLAKRFFGRIGLPPPTALRRLFSGNAALAEAATVPRFLAPLYTGSTKPPVTVVLDLDETLVKTFELDDESAEPTRGKPNLHSEIFFGMGDIVHYCTYFRPGLLEFLRELRTLDNCEVMVYTLGVQQYVDEVINAIDGEKGKAGALFRHRLYSQHGLPCPLAKRQKDMRVLNRDLSRVISIDDSVYSYLRQPDNSIPVPAYKGPNTRPVTTEKEIFSFVLDEVFKAAKEDDVRPYLQKRFGLRSALEKDSTLRRYMRSAEVLNLHTVPSVMEGGKRAPPVSILQ
uniref:Mitochondrial import inner membrane translocase subunit TIM50 n=1 Tax=Palpitomonas bilix TaxID=652834 RepID=A0A7S3DIR9_9EUKA|mmetsp:Transcript_38764/g.99508  ORF Transcript_38764/g.99508 Transcript_38764/m.99508 type:complete len:284 (+) Transcript_38764:95-946(+)